MGVIWYRARRLLRTAIGPTVLVGLLIAATLGLVVFVAGGATRTLSAPSRYEATFGGTFDALVEQGEGEPQRAELEALPSVAVVHSSTFLFAMLLDADGHPVESLVFAGEQESFGTRMDEGRPPRSTDEIAVSHAFVEQTGARLGDRFRFVSVARETARASGFDVAEPDGPSFDVTVVGTFTGATELQDSYALAVMPTAVLDQDVGIAATQHVVGLAADADTADLRADLDGLPGGSDFGIKSAELVPETVADAVTSRGQGITAVAVVLALASMVAVGQLLGRQHRLTGAEATALRTMGMTRAQLVADPVARSLTPVAIGLVLGSSAAYLASGWFPLGFVEPVETDPGLRFEPKAVLIVGPLVALGILGWVAVAARSALRPRPVPTRPGAIETVVARLRPLTAAMGARFAFTRHRTGTSSPLASVAGLVVLAGLAVTATMLGASIDNVLDHPQRYALADLSIGAGGGPMSDDQIAVLTDDPELSSITLLGSTFVSVGSDAIDLTGQRVVRGTSPTILLAGTMPTSDDEAVVGTRTADLLHLEVGDPLEVDGPNGRQELHVSGLAVVPSSEGGDGVGEGILTTEAGLRRLDPDAGMSGGLLEVASGASIDEVGGRLSETLEADVHPPDRPIAIIAMERIRAMPYLVAVALAALAVVALSHQLLVTSRLRRHDVAVLRALGADGRWAANAIHWQATSTAVSVALIATAVGIGAGRWFTGGYLAGIGLERDALLPWSTLAIAVGALVVVANLVGLLPAFRVHRQRIGVDLRDR